MEELDNTDALLEGENILASVVRNNQNTQWYDERLDADIRQANHWNFHPQPLSISVLLDTKAPSSLVEDRGGFRNSTEVEINWRLLANATDLAGFRIDAGTGALELIGIFATDPVPRPLTIDPSGRYVYVAGTANRLGAFAIDAGTGGLTPLPSCDTGPVSWVLSARLS